jgi:translation initiation factor IF-1
LGADALSPSSTPASHEQPANGPLGERNGEQILAKEDLLTIEGVVDEILPDGRFGVLLDNQYRIIAYTAGKMRRYRIRSIVGDRVHVEMTPYDLSKGRIVYREKIPGQSSGPRRGSFRR